MGDHRRLGSVLLGAAVMLGACADEPTVAVDSPPTAAAPVPTTASTAISKLPATTVAPVPTTAPTDVPAATATTELPATTVAPETTEAAPAPPPAIETVTAADLPASWRDGCPVHVTDLRRVTVPHRGFDGADRTGVLIVHADWADELLAVFTQLHAAGFPVERIEPVDVYGGSDDASMAANNTSAFNCRPVTGGSGWSRHAYGRAVDINPVQNPYVTGDGRVLPPSGAPYAHDRSPRPGVIIDGDAVVSAFAVIGWRWGGHWTDPVDYQHFDTSG